MDVAKVRAELEQANTTAHIVENSPDGVHVTELVREGGGTELVTTAMAVIERSPRHFHKCMTEIYRVDRGVLTLHVDEVTTQLVTGEEFRIDPGRRHWAESDSDAPAWVHVACSPPFSPTDYFLDE